LLLTTTGAKSGEPRVAPLVVFRIDGKLLIVAGYGGADVNPAWVHNLRANPRAHVDVATGSFDVVARKLHRVADHPTWSWGPFWDQYRNPQRLRPPR
jgi:deazaflavin-dependent oxidoreductase (nitroreductase family)